jgi:hypothetical protein
MFENRGSDLLPKNLTETFILQLNNIICDTSLIKSFYNDNKISNFICKCVCYLGVIGTINSTDFCKSS